MLEKLLRKGFSFKNIKESNIYEKIKRSSTVNYLDITVGVFLYSMVALSSFNCGGGGKDGNGPTDPRTYAPKITGTQPEQTIESKIGQKTKYEAIVEDRDGRVASIMWYVENKVEKDVKGKETPYPTNFSYEPTQQKKYNIKLEVKDNEGKTASYQWNNDVTDNLSPIVSLTPEGTITLSKRSSVQDRELDASAIDPDDYENPYVTLTLTVNDSTIATATSSDTANVLYNFRTEDWPAGTYLVKAIADDGGKSSEKDLTIIVQDGNQNTAPKLADLPSIILNEDELPSTPLIDLKNYASDKETSNESLQYIITSQSNPDLMLKVINGELFVDSYKKNSNGVANFEIKLVDPQGLESMIKNFRITINPMTDFNNLELKDAIVLNHIYANEAIKNSNNEIIGNFDGNAVANIQLAQGQGILIYGGNNNIITWQPYTLNNGGQDFDFGVIRTASNTLKFEEIRDTLRDDGFKTFYLGRGEQAIRYVNITGIRNKNQMPYDQTQRHKDSNTIFNDEFGDFIKLQNPKVDSTNLTFVKVENGFDETDITKNPGNYIKNNETALVLTTDYVPAGGAGINSDNIGWARISNASQNMRLQIGEKLKMATRAQESALPYWDKDTFLAGNVLSHMEIVIGQKFPSSVSYLTGTPSAETTSKELNYIKFLFGVPKHTELGYDNQNNRILILPPININ